MKIITNEPTVHSQSFTTIYTSKLTGKASTNPVKAESRRGEMFLVEKFMAHSSWFKEKIIQS